MSKQNSALKPPLHANHTNEQPKEKCTQPKHEEKATSTSNVDKQDKVHQAKTSLLIKTTKKVPRFAQASVAHHIDPSQFQHVFNAQKRACFSYITEWLIN